MTRHAIGRVIVAAAAALLLGVAPGFSQTAEDPDTRPAFSLSSSEVFTSRDNPSFYLTFRHITQLDFRVYKVRDPVKFFQGLRDPHQFGSMDVPVPTERSWIERLADWKRRQRSEIRTFLRAQVSYEYRADRRAQRDRQEVAQRVTLNQSTFAQVPLLNPDQLVTAWRELLPNLRDPEMRRIPLEVKEQGLYLVEAVSGVLRAYTIVVISDLGLVTKVAPGQMVVFAANRLTGEPAPSCDVRVLASQKEIASGTTNADGVLDATLPMEKAEDLVTLARCGDQVGVTDPGAWYLSEPSRQLVGYVYSDKPIYRPGHTVHIKAVLRWRERDALRPFDRPSAELSVSDINDKVVFRQSLKVDEFGAVHASFPVPATAALGNYTVRVASADQQASGSFEVQEYRRPEFEVIVTPASRFVVQGEEVVATVDARYYFGQPVANGRVRYVVNKQPYYSPFRWDDGFEGEEGRVVVRRRSDARRRAAARRARARRDPRAHRRRREQAGLQPAHRGASHRCEQPRSQRQHHRTCDLRLVSDFHSGQRLRVPAGPDRHDVRARPGLHRQSAAQRQRDPRPRSHHLPERLLQRARGDARGRDVNHPRRHRPRRCAADAGESGRHVSDSLDCARRLGSRRGTRDHGRGVGVDPGRRGHARGRRAIAISSSSPTKRHTPSVTPRG